MSWLISKVLKHKIVKKWGYQVERSDRVPFSDKESKALQGTARQGIAVLGSQDRLTVVLQAFPGAICCLAIYSQSQGCKCSTAVVQGT